MRKASKEDLIRMIEELKLRLEKAEAQAEEKLQQSRTQAHFLADILQNASHPFAIGYPDGTVGLHNKAFEELTGYSAEELHSIDWANALTPPEWREFETSKLQLLNQTGHPVRYEKEYIRKDGQRVPIELLVHLVRDDEGRPEYYYSFLTDITGRKQAENELRQKEQLLQTVIDGSTSPIFLKDLNGKFITINKALEKMLGISREEIKGKTDYDIASVEAADYWRTHDQQVMATRKAIQIEEVADLQDGHHIFLANKFPLVDVTGQICGIGAISHDITDRKRAEEELRQLNADLDAERQLWKQVVENIPDAIFMLDTAGNIILTNEAYATYHRFKNREEASKHFEQFQNTFEVFHPDGSPAPPESWATYRAMKGEKVALEEYLIYRKDTDERWWGSYHSAPLRDDNGKINGALVSARDITESKRTDAALRESEERFRVAQELSPDGFLIFRPLRDERGVVSDFLWIYENEAAARMNDTDPNKVCGKRVSEVLPHHDQSPFGKAYKEVAETGEVRVLDQALYDQDTFQQRRWFRVVAVPTAGGDVAVLVQNVTERVKAQETLRRQAEVIDLSPDAIIIRKLDGTIAFWSRGAETMYGWTRDEALGKTTHALLRTKFPKPLTEIVSELEQQDRWSGELIHQTRDGQEIIVQSFWLSRKDADGEIAELLESNVDITGRKQTEEKLRKSEYLRRMSQEISGVGTFEWNIVTGVNTWTPELEALYGLPPGGFTGTQDAWEQLVHPEDRARAVAAVQSAFETGETVEAEWRAIWPDGTTHWLAGRFRILRDEEQKPLTLTGVNIDMTERKRAEENLKTSLREKEVLLKEIHHRVKNNMQVISSLVDLQADQLGDTGTKAVLQDVTHRVRSMALVHEKLYQSADMARIDFADYAQSLLGYLWRAYGTASADIKLTLDLEQAALSINAAVPCGLILNELATNSLKHAFIGRDNGEVTVSLRADSEGQVDLCLRDNGKGLPAGFDWRASKSLGLSLVQILAKQLSATVKVSNDQGTEFSLNFKA